MTVGVACDGVSATPDACTAGDTQTCERSSGCEAERVCAGDPSRWGACECTRPPSPIALPKLGEPCSDDSDCPRPGTCLSPASRRYFGGGPPGGVCVADCSDDSAACDAFADAVCVRTTASSSPRQVPATEADADDAGLDGTAGAEGDADDGGTPDGAAEPEERAFCFETCSVGDAPADKCHNREDVACEALAAGETEGFCRPLCAADSECDSARRCDLRTGACIETESDAPPTAHASLGRSCDQSLGGAECDGQCVELSDDYAACGQRCVFGSPSDCAPLPSSPTRGGCLFTSPMGTIHDVGFCAELCDCAIDCSHPDAICDGFTNPELSRVFGRPGVCTPPELALGPPQLCD